MRDGKISYVRCEESFFQSIGFLRSCMLSYSYVEGSGCAKIGLGCVCMYYSKTNRVLELVITIEHRFCECRVTR